MKVRKAVIPAAGFGTRFLPQTKAMPKEMLPIVDKPIIQRVVEELVDAGIEDIVIVTGYHKRSIEDHFDRPGKDLERNLMEGGESKQKLLAQLEHISDMANFVYVRQKGPYGNGTPLLNVRHLIGDEPFIYTWSDDFIEAEPVSRFKQLINAYDTHGSSVLSALKAKTDVDYTRYAVSDGEEIAPGLMKIKRLVEKPGKADAPSDTINMSGGLFTPEIFDYLDAAVSNLKPGNELYYVDALDLMIKDNKQVLSLVIENGKYYDTGNKLEYLKTVVEFGLKHPEIGKDFGEWLHTLERLNGSDHDA